MQEVNLEIAPRVDELHCAKFKVDPGELGLLAIPVSSRSPSHACNQAVKRAPRTFFKLFVVLRCKGGWLTVGNKYWHCNLDLASRLCA